MGPRPVLDHVQVAAPGGCEAQARWFYGTLIGLDELEKPATLRDRGGLWFGLGDSQLHIGVEAPFAPARKAHPALRCVGDELDAIAIGSWASKRRRASFRCPPASRSGCPPPLAPLAPPVRPSPPLDPPPVG